MMDMEIIKCEVTREPINEFMYFQCLEYTVKYKDNTFIYSKKRGENKWYHVNQKGLNRELYDVTRLNELFEKSYKHYKRRKVLEKVCQ